MAKDKRYLTEVPKIKKPRFKKVQSDYSYLRSQEEIKRFLVAANEEGEVAYALYLTAINTGMRQAELGPGKK